MIDESEIKRRITRYKADLPKHSDPYLVQKHVTFGEPIAFSNDKYLELKAEIAGNFEIHPTEVVMVGSGKLGFSIAPLKRYNYFGDTSDLDIAIVCAPLFDAFWLASFEYWRSRLVWPELVLFQENLLRGYIRPEMLPGGNRIPLRKVWWEFFRDLSSLGKFGPYKISGRLYKSWQYFEGYQRTCMAQCRRELGKP